MDCIFKSLGYIPKNHVCSNCAPLETLIISTGCDKEDAIRTSKRLLRAFVLVKLEDVFRDEALHRKIIAKALSIPFMASLPKAIRRNLKQLNSDIRQLEKSSVDPTSYIEQLSHIGGSICANSSSNLRAKRRLYSMGTIFMGAGIIQDMTKDLVEDTKRGKFNPLKGCNAGYIETLAQKFTQRFQKFADPILANSLIATPTRGNFQSNLFKIVCPPTIVTAPVTAPATGGGACVCY